MAGVTLGLDIGPNSIGWALVDQANKRIVGLGVRHFPEGVDNFDTRKEKSRNEDRRLARSMRRQIRRRSVRRHRLRDTLVQLGLFPADEAEQERLYALDPYELRTLALDGRITLHELGRVLLQMNQRRGFLSNKKSRTDTEVEGMLGEMNETEQQITESGDRTVGEWLHGKGQAMDHARRSENDHVRGRHQQRRWLTDEFDRIWAAQAGHHDVLTDELAFGKLGRQKGIDRPMPKSDHRRRGMGDLESFGLFGLMFFHRTLKPVPKEIIGACELEPKQKRCPRADRPAQRFRLLQEVNNLRLIDDSASPPSERHLNEQERALLLDKLTGSKEATFDQMRKWIGKLPDSPAEERMRFNLEEGKRKNLKGMVTDALLAAEGGKHPAVGKAWRQFDEDKKDAIVHALIHSVDDDETHEQLVTQFGLTPKQADDALTVDFSTGPTAGYMHFSLMAINKLLPYLDQGMRLMANDETDSAMHAAGYLRRDQLQRRVFDKLPDPRRVSDAPIGDIPNPVVKRAIVELRKVVNAIIREYGRPAAVHVEMAREVRQGAQQRQDYNSRIRDIEADRDKAKKTLEDNGQSYGSRGVNILRVLLWEQQSHGCVYCGKKISVAQLFNDGLVDIDHILPYSRTLDDSQMNKVVCHRECNHDKGNSATPYEWLADTDPGRYETICQHVYSLVRKSGFPYRKYKRFIQKELDLDQFIARQLTDTGYIARVTGEYLRCLFEHDHDVLGLKGQHTAELRWQWGLNSVLRHDDVDRKNRDDHRHHAVDAVVIALMNRSRLQELTHIRKSGNFDKSTGEVYELPAPWDGFREQLIESMNQINISHRAERKVAGALHMETFYGQTEQPGVFVVRKPLESLTANEVPLIRDLGIRRVIEDRLAEHGLEVGRGKKIDPRKWKQALCDVNNPLILPPSQKRLKADPDAKGIPIKKVRVLRKEKTIQSIRSGTADEVWVKPGSTHHLCLFEWQEEGKTKRGAISTTMLEAMQRIKNKQSIIQRTHPSRADARFVMSLSRGEMVLAKVDGAERLLIYNSAPSTSHQMTFFDHLDARPLKDRKKFSFQPSTLDARKVTVDPLGRIRWAND